LDQEIPPRTDYFWLISNIPRLLPFVVVIFWVSYTEKFMMVGTGLVV